MTSANYRKHAFCHDFFAFVVEAIWHDDDRPCRLTIIASEELSGKMLGIEELHIAPELWPSDPQDRERFVTSQFTHIEESARNGRWPPPISDT